MSKKSKAANKKQKGTVTKPEQASRSLSTEQRRRLRIGAIAIAIFVILSGAGVILYRHYQESHYYAFGAFKGYNVLLITIDTLRADHLPVYGYKHIKTPNLDHLAHDSLIFDRAISHVPLTLPSHTSILTGLLPIAHGVRDNSGYFLDKKVTTLAEVLKSKGYNTAAFVSAFVLDSEWQLNQGFDLYFDHFNQFEDISSREIQRSAGQTEPEVEKWLVSNPKQPFFCWVHFYDPHDPYTPPEPYKTEYASNPYDGEIAYVDENVGKLLSKLNDLHLQNNTLIFVTGDHGEAFGEHGEKAHSLFVYEVTLHVPLFIHMPSGMNRRIPGVVGHIDIAPTILEWLGFTPPKEMQGKSLLPMLQGKEQRGRSVYSESIFAQLHYGWSPLTALTTDSYEFIHAPRLELYDLKNDPAEITNLAADKASIAKVMQSQLEDTIRTGLRDASGGPQKMDVDAEEKLRALGYITGTVESTAESLKIDPKDKVDEVVLLNRAYDALARKQETEALGYLNTVIAQDPNIVEARFARGVAYNHLQRHAEAIQELQAALRMSPNHTGSLYTLANVYEFTGDYQNAEKYYLRVLELEPNHRYAKMKLSFVYRMMHQPEKSLYYLNQLVNFYTTALSTTSESKNRSSLFSALSEVYFAAGNFTQAESALREALQLTPDSAKLHDDLAQIYEQRSDIPNAIAQYEKEVELDSSNYETYSNLGLLYAKTHNFEKGAYCFEQSLHLRPADPRASFWLAEMYMALNRNYEQALQLTQTTLAQQPNFKEAYTLLSYIYNKLGRQEEAREAERQAQALPPDKEGS